VISLGRDKHIGAIGRFPQFYGLCVGLLLAYALESRTVFAAVDKADFTAKLIGKSAAVNGIIGGCRDNFASHKTENIGEVVGENIVKLHPLLLQAVVNDFLGWDCFSADF
jgi:hypothetical protein